MAGAPPLEPEEMQDLRHGVAGVEQLFEGDFHHSFRRPVFDFFQEHIVDAQRRIDGLPRSSLGRAHYMMMAGWGQEVVRGWWSIWGEAVLG